MEEDDEPYDDHLPPPRQLTHAPRGAINKPRALSQPIFPFTTRFPAAEYLAFRLCTDLTKRTRNMNDMKTNAMKTNTTLTKRMKTRFHLDRGDRRPRPARHPSCDRRAEVHRHGRKRSRQSDRRGCFRNERPRSPGPGATTSLADGGWTSGCSSSRHRP